MKKLLWLSVVLATAGAAYAGWIHIGKQTSWSDGPTEATLWRRDNDTLRVFPAVPVQVFYNTIRELGGGVAINTNDMVSTGYWQMRTDGSVYPRDLTEITALSTAPGGLRDCEWDLRSDGSIYPKE